jgi:hypothetical protein
MTTVREIEAAIEQLPRSELLKLTRWISSRFSDEWDREIEEDIKKGASRRRLFPEFRAGRATAFPPGEE